MKKSFVLYFHTKIIWILSKNFSLKYGGIITGLSFTDIMPPYFKDKFFETIQIIFVWKYNTKDSFIPYMLAMDVLYIKCWCCLRSDQIIHNILSCIYLLLRPFTSIVVGDGQYYVLLLAHYVTTRRD